MQQRYLDIVKKGEWEKFVDKMYAEHKIVFINANEINNSNGKILEYATAILMCGNETRDMVRELLKPDNDWIFIKTKNSFTCVKNHEYKHKLKKQFMI